MSLVKVSDLAPSQPKDRISRAEALIAAYLCPALTGLEEQAVTAAWTPLMLRAPLGEPRQAVNRFGPDILGAWPITSVQGVLLDGVDHTPRARFTPFAIYLDDLLVSSWGAWGGGFGVTAQSTASFAFTVGWTAATLPPAIRQAVALFADGMLARPDASVTLVRNDEVTVQWADSSAQSGIPSSIAALLAPWKWQGAG